MRKSDAFKLGVSIAFSHGTANALIMGTFLMHNRGLADFILWAIPNSLCILLFGLIYHRGLLRREVLSNNLIRLGMFTLQCSMLLLELKLLQTYMLQFTDSSLWATVLASILAGSFILWMLKDGLNLSIFTHLWQGGITLISFSLVVAYCILADVPKYSIPATDTIPWGWFVWTSCVYVSSMIADLQHWQRADIDITKTAFCWGTSVFACLMLLIGMIASFDVPLEVQLFMLLPLVMLSTSTIDSLAVAMHGCINKYVGTAILMIIVCGWWLLLDDEAIDVWNYHGIVRCINTVLIVTLSAYWWRQHYVLNRRCLST